MFEFLLKMLIDLLNASTTGSFDDLLASNSEGCIKCVSLNNKPCHARLTLINKSSNKPFYYPFNLSINKCGRRGNTVDDPSAQVCVPNKVKNKNAIVIEC